MPERLETLTPKVAALADDPLNTIREGADPPVGSEARPQEMVRAQANVPADDGNTDAERDHLDWLENQLSTTRAERMHRATFLLTIMVSALAVCLVTAAIIWRLIR